MIATSRILVVAATNRELAPSGGWAMLRCGVGPVDAAAATAAAIAEQHPLAVVHVGIAGARQSSGVRPPALVVGAESIYCDLDVPARFAPRRLLPYAPFVDAACRALPAAIRLAIGTSGRVGSTTGCDIEAMEGFAVLRAAALAGVPAVEIRAISNAIEESDRSRWSVDDACAAIVAATPALVREIASCVS